MDGKKRLKIASVIVLIVCDYFTQWYLSTSTTVDLYPFFIGHYPLSPSPPVPFGLSFILSPLSLPLLTWLPQCHVTMYLPMIANPDIAKVTRLASLLPIIIHSLLPLNTQSRLTRDRPTPSSIPSHVHTLVLPTTILSRDSSCWYFCISDLVGSPPDLRISLVTLGPSFLGFGHCSDPFRSIRIILRSIWLILDIGDRTFFGDSSYQ